MVPSLFTSVRLERSDAQPQTPPKVSGKVAGSSVSVVAPEPTAMRKRPPFLGSARAALTNMLCAATALIPAAMASWTKSRRDIFPFAASLVIDLISIELFSPEIAVSELARRLRPRAIKTVTTCHHSALDRAENQTMYYWPKA